MELGESGGKVGGGGGGARIIGSSEDVNFSALGHPI